MNNRDEVQILMNDCRNGKVDLILMKSLSRFGHNTLDVLLMLDELSKLNVVVHLETEDIWTNDCRVKKCITMAAAAYQEESRQKSEAIKWCIRQSSCHGYVKLNHPQFLGYGRDDNGNLVVIEEEAKIVQLIYDLFLQVMAAVKSKNILKLTISKLSLVKTSAHQSLTEPYPMKNILVVMLLPKLILLIFSQKN